VELTAQEGRVLGCLIEKQLTTPQQYPLTDNALLAACNQTTSREPVVSYDVATVRLAVRSLRERDLLRTMRTGERSEKHRHLLDDTLGLSTPQQTLLALLLLRGPQTAAELRTRSERMHAFGSAEEVERTLEGMGDFIERLERQPGQKGGRFGQRLVEAEPDEVTVLRSEVARLRAENEELRNELAQNRGGSV
jgi:uncharacterized protein YceH (UPF0502 family)